MTRCRCRCWWRWRGGSRRSRSRSRTLSPKARRTRWPGSRRSPWRRRRRWRSRRRRSTPRRRPRPRATGRHPPMASSRQTKETDMADSTSNKPYGNVTYADPKNGKYPIDTEEHARAAWAYINMAKNAAMYPMGGVTLSEVKGRIRAACKKFGIDISDDDGDSGSASRAELMRDYPLEDLHIVRSADGGDGRTMEAFAAVFSTETEIKDPQGHYLEVIEPHAFNKRLG